MKLFRRARGTRRKELVTASNFFYDSLGTLAGRFLGDFGVSEGAGAFERARTIDGIGDIGS